MGIAAVCLVSRRISSLNLDSNAYIQCIDETFKTVHACDFLHARLRRGLRFHRLIGWQCRPQRQEKSFDGESDLQELHSGNLWPVLRMDANAGFYLQVTVYSHQAHTASLEAWPFGGDIGATTRAWLAVARAIT